jgi:hypothetical protein
MDEDDHESVGYIAARMAQKRVKFRHAKEKAKREKVLKNRQKENFETSAKVAKRFFLSYYFDLD